MKAAIHGVLLGGSISARAVVELRATNGCNKQVSGRRCERRIKPLLAASCYCRTRPTGVLRSTRLVRPKLSFLRACRHHTSFLTCRWSRHSALSATPLITEKPMVGHGLWLALAA